MLDLNDFFYFVQVVERRGFTAAGRALGLPKSTLSHRMKKLEAELGVRLLNRTSRHFAPTQAGEETRFELRAARGRGRLADGLADWTKRRGSGPGRSVVCRLVRPD